MCFMASKSLHGILTKIDFPEKFIYFFSPEKLALLSLLREIKP